MKKSILIAILCAFTAYAVNAENLPTEVQNEEIANIASGNEASYNDLTMDTASDEFLFSSILGLFTKVKDKVMSWFKKGGKATQTPPEDVCTVVKKNYPTKKEMLLGTHPDKVCGGASNFDQCVADQSEVFKAATKCY